MKLKCVNSKLLAVLVLWIIVFVSFAACSKKIIDEEVEVIYLADTERNYMSKIIESIEYVKLEYSGRSFTKADKLFVVDSGIILADFWSNHTLLRYDHNGKFLNSFGRFGEGPGEYVQITDVDFDEENNHLVVLSRNHLITYGIDGIYMHELPLKKRPPNFLKIDSGRYLFYFPEVLNPKLRAGIDDAILYYYYPESEILEPIMNPIFQDRLYAMGDKHVLFKTGNGFLFSAIFCDTIYSISGDGAKKKFFLDFGSEQNDLSRLYGLPTLDLVRVVNGDSFRQAYHVPHLFVNSRYLVSAFNKKPRFDFFLYDLKEEVPYLSSKMVNDVDEGMGFGIIKGMDDDYLYSYFEPEEILRHYEENQVALDKVDNDFTAIAKKISRDDFLIIAKFKLRK